MIRCNNCCSLDFHPKTCNIQEDIIGIFFCKLLLEVFMAHFETHVTMNIIIKCIVEFNVVYIFLILTCGRS